MPNTYTIAITVPDKIEDAELLTEVADQLEAVSDYLNTLVEDCDEDYPNNSVVDWTDMDTQTKIKSHWSTSPTQM